MIDFFLPCIPFKTTHHAKRIVRIGRFSRLADKPELVQARQTYESLLTPHRPAKPLEGALSLRIEFTFPYLKSHTKKERARVSLPKTSKPDCSNLAKTMEDCLVRMGFMIDDGQVFSLHVLKFYDSNPGIRIIIEDQ